MTQYLIRRVLIAIPTLLVISMVVYAILALAPTDPLSQFAANPAVPPAVRENIRHQMGLDLPWYIRYFPGWPRSPKATGATPSPARGRSRP